MRAPLHSDTKVRRQYRQKGRGVGVARKAWSMQALEENMSLPNRSDAPYQRVAVRRQVRPVVLVIEDAAVERRGIELLLAGSGLTPLPVATARAALAIARVVLLDVLLIDLRIRDGRGDILARDITHLQPGIGVVYMSTASDSAVLVPGIVLQKPLEVDRLIDCLLELSARRATLPPAVDPRGASTLSVAALALALAEGHARPVPQGLIAPGPTYLSDG